MATHLLYSPFRTPVDKLLITHTEREVLNFCDIRSLKSMCYNVRVRDDILVGRD